MKLQKTILITVLLIAAASAASANTPSFELNITETEPDPMEIGSYANIRAQVTNTGDSTARNVNITMREKFPFKIKEGERKEFRFREIEQGETVRFRATVNVDSTALQGEERIQWRIQHRSGATNTFTGPVDLRVDDTSMIIDSIDFPERVTSGSTNEMTLKVNNLVNANFRNIDVKLNVDDPDLPMSPVESSRKRITNIQANGEDEVSFDVNVDEDADNGVYKLPIEMDYDNQMGEEIETQQTTGVVVGGSPQLNIGLEDTNIRRPGIRDTVTFNVINRGAGEARYTEIEIQQDESDEFDVISERTEYIGTMISDDFQTAEFDLYVEEDAETLEVPVEASFVDEDGEMREETFNVTNRLYTEEEIQRLGLEQRGQGVLAIAGIAIVTLIVGALYYRKRKVREE